MIMSFWCKSAVEINEIALIENYDVEYLNLFRYHAHPISIRSYGALL